MNVETAITAASAPVVNYAGRNGHVLFGGDDPPTTPTALGAKRKNLRLG